MYVTIGSSPIPVHDLFPRPTHPPPKTFMWTRYLCLRARTRVCPCPPNRSTCARCPPHPRPMPRHRRSSWAYPMLMEEPGGGGGGYIVAHPTDYPPPTHGSQFVRTFFPMGWCVWGPTQWMPLPACCPLDCLSPLLPSTCPAQPL